MQQVKLRNVGFILSGQRVRGLTAHAWIHCYVTSFQRKFEILKYGKLPTIKIEKSGCVFILHSIHFGNIYDICKD